MCLYMDKCVQRHVPNMPTIYLAVFLHKEYNQLYKIVFLFTYNPNSPLTINLPMADNLHPASTVEAASVEPQYFLHQRGKTQQHHSTTEGTLYQSGKMFYMHISLVLYFRRQPLEKLTFRPIA